MLAWHGGTVAELNEQVVAEFDDRAGPHDAASRSSLRAYRARLASLRQLLFELGVSTSRRGAGRGPAPGAALRRRGDGRGDPGRAAALRADPRQRCCGPSSVESLVNDLLPFAEFLTAHHPEVTSLRDLQRSHVEEFLAWNRTRPWRGRKARPQPVSAAVAQSAVLTLRNMLEDITAWGWAEAPTRRLVFAADIPKLDRPLPRALPPDVDAALMAAVADLDDPFARAGLQVLRGTGLRVGELLDLSSTPSSTTAPPGPGYGSRSASSPPNAPSPSTPPPWPPSTSGPPPRRATARSRTRAPATHRLPVHRARPPPRRDPAAQRAARRRRRSRPARPGRRPLTVTPHQLRHTYATALANAGMSLQALMALLGHVTPEMTIRYATLASPDPARRLRRGDGQDAPPADPDPGRTTDRPGQGRLAGQRDAQDPRRARLLLPPRGPGRLPLRQHLRDLRQLHPRPRVRARPDRPARRHPSPASRRRTARLDRRRRNATDHVAEAHREPPRPSSNHADPTRRDMLDPPTRAG